MADSFLTWSVEHKAAKRGVKRWLSAENKPFMAVEPLWEGPAPAMDGQIKLQGQLTGADAFERAVMMTREAGPADIDELGHVNNAVYLFWAQDVAVAHWRSAAPPSLREQFVWVALRHEIDYRDEVRAGENVEVRTWLGRASGPRFERFVDIRRPGSPRFAAKVLTIWCLIDARTRKPRRVGPEILEPFGVSGK